jgi:hypothetical protein
LKCRRRTDDLAAFILEARDDVHRDQRLVVHDKNTLAGNRLLLCI